MVKGPRTKKIFVGGIPTSITEGKQESDSLYFSCFFICFVLLIWVTLAPEIDELQEYFSKFGKISERQIMQDRETGRSRGFGFVTFESEDSVDDLLAHNVKLELGGKPV
jgi:hypothetical protein